MCMLTSFVPMHQPPSAKNIMPPTRSTSGLASLPLHASVALLNFYNHYVATATTQLSEMFDPILQYHQYLTGSRLLDEDVALVYISVCVCVCVCVVLCGVCSAGEMMKKSSWAR